MRWEGCCHKGRLGIESLTNVFSMICKLSAVLGRLAKATRICSTKVLCFGGVAVNGIHGGSAVAVSNGRLISSAHRGCGNSCKQGTLRSRGIRCTNSVCCAGVSHHAGMAFNAIVGKRLAEALAAFAGLRCSGHAITCCCVGDICSNTMEGGYIVKGAAALAAGHLIPLASIRRSNHAVGNFWLFKLRGVEHIHRSRFAIRGNCGRTDMASCDLRSLKLESLHLGHIVAKAPVRYITGNRAGSAGRSGRYRGNGVPIQGSTIPGGDTTEGAANESGTAIEAHAGATFYNGITDIGVGAESGSETGGKAICGSTGSGSSGISAPAEDTARAANTAACPGDDSGSHHQFHAHAGPGLRHIQADGGQIAVESLGALQISQCAEHPQENASFTGGQRTTVCDELSHGRGKTTKEPDVHDKEQQLGTNHSAPGFEHGTRGFGAAHRKGER